MTICLSYEEIVDITHRKKPSLQQVALRSMGIDFRVRPDGTIAVFRNPVELPLGNKKKISVNIEALRRCQENAKKRT